MPTIGPRGPPLRRLQRSSSTAPPASHGRRWPTSSAPPGTAPAPAAAGRARAPTRCTKRANASTAQQRKTAPPHRTGIAGPVFVAIRARRGPGGRILTSGLPGAPGRFYHHQAPAGPQAARRLPKRARQLPYCEKSHGGGLTVPAGAGHHGVDGRGGFSLFGLHPPTPATTRHTAPQAWLPQLACGAFFGAGGASNRPAGATRPRPGATPAHAPRPTVSSSSTGAGHGTRASRKRSRPSSSTAAPASHGRRWPTS